MSDKSRLRWLCRRGMKELDVLLERFVGGQYDSLDARQRDQLLALLNKEDPDLYALVMRRASPDNATQADLLARIRRPGRLSESDDSAGATNP